MSATFGRGLPDSGARSDRLPTFLVVALFAWGSFPAIGTGLAGSLASQALVVQVFGIETRQASLEAVSAAEPSVVEQPVLAGASNQHSDAKAGAVTHVGDIINA